MTAGRYVILLAVATLFAVLAVAQRTEALHLGYRLVGLESQRRVLADQNRQLLCEINTLAEPGRIADQLERSGVPLMDPVALTQPPAEDRGREEIRSSVTARR